ncbi:MAG: 30S ribosomal protein S3 [Candidatus Wildermuthbacteria bacterium]|nr:30S ribosomal protein S3 [Candidatus Wildermuthbacteria bacterium]
MSHKVHPKIFRVRGIQDWESRWFEKRNYSALLREDFLVREFLLGKLKDAAIERIEIERDGNKLIVIINTARPGIIIGKGGSGVDMLRKAIEAIIVKARQTQPAKSGGGKKKTDIKLEIREVKNPWESAPLVAQWVAQQLEKRMPFRRTLKQTLGKVMLNKDVKGVKIEVSGRLGGADIARREWMKEGRLPLQTMRSVIDYSLAEALTTFGTIGVKVWLYKGEKFE